MRITKTIFENQSLVVLLPVLLLNSSIIIWVLFMVPRFSVVANSSNVETEFLNLKWNLLDSFIIVLFLHLTNCLLIVYRLSLHLRVYSSVYPEHYTILRRARTTRAIFRINLSVCRLTIRGRILIILLYLTGAQLHRKLQPQFLLSITYWILSWS